MRINVYTEELQDASDHPKSFAEIVTADYISVKTGEKMTNYGIRIFLRSAPELHYVPPRDDDRSAVTFWCGSKKSNIFRFLDTVREYATLSEVDMWRNKVIEQNNDAIEAERLRNVLDMDGKNAKY
jgi:hypothetical protein